MPDPLFPPPPAPLIPLAGEDAAYPVRRVFCVGRNYAAHAAEMGAEVDREAPFYFTKSPAHVVAAPARVAYPKGTGDYHHEVELAVMLDADGAPLGYACALDMTRRDLQAAAKAKRRPWDLGKDVEGSAVIGAVARADAVGDLAGRRIWLTVDGAVRQDATLDEMIHDVPAILSDLAGYYDLGAGDVVLTGTPAGVGAVAPGATVAAGVDGLPEVRLTLTPRD